MICVAVGLVGGVLGGLALAVYFRDRSHAAAPVVAQQQPSVDATANRNDSHDATATSAPATQVERASAQNTQPDGNAQATAESPAAGDAARPPATADGDDNIGDSATEADAGTRDELQSALGDWIAATNARDINRQMKFYAPTINAYYLTRNASRESVRAEKARVFSNADSVDVRASAPDIRLSRDGQTAIMRFRKRYRIGGGEAGRSGEVLQELRWRRTHAGWKIVGERDLRVLQ
jgi:ketosteroid isomerase-like protein